MPGAGVGRPPGTQGRLTEYLPSSRRSSSSNAFIAAVPSAAVSSAGVIRSALISQNLRKASSSEPSHCNRKTPASGARFRLAFPHVIQPRPLTHRLTQLTHRPQAALSAAVPHRLRSLPVSHPGTPPAPSGPLNIPEGLLAPASECRHLDGLSPRLLQAEIPPSSIGAPAPHDLPESRLLPPCRRGNSLTHDSRPARTLERGPFGDTPQGNLGQPGDPGGPGLASATEATPSSVTGEVIYGAAGGTRPLHRADLRGILSPCDRSPNIGSRLP
ncbi:hypothetical protein T03_13309 [Trichinella britovi]|uniref:Uncharacterized protein n=1 Tax=Trichinella britovi TaxID=45882 RepID=A0A0V1CTZ0_TRIBR|nr:hypothetical protein T03_13309 [Trichinella britovi]